MNIFVSDPNPITSAFALDDKRVNKMIVESTQMLATYLIANKVKEEYIPHKVNGDLYRRAFVNHPCNRWLFESFDNVRWLHKHAYTLCYVYRLSFNRQHACEEEIKRAGKGMISLMGITLKEKTPFSFCDCTGLPPSNDSIFDRYKECLRRKWYLHNVNWTNRPQPIWL